MGLERHEARALVMAALGNDRVGHIFDEELLATNDIKQGEIPTPLLLKLAEEASELSQAILKATNPSSSSYKELGQVLEEAGHTLMFLTLLDVLSERKVTLHGYARMERHLRKPKPTNKATLSYISKNTAQLWNKILKKSKG